MRVRAAAVLSLTAAFSSGLVAQQPAAPAAPTLDFSGVIFGNYQYRTDSAAKAVTGGKSPNSFNVDRVYLTFRMPVGDKTSIRATTDITPNAAGYIVRLKYGYLQRALTTNLFGIDGLSATARVGMLHTVVVDHEEAYWPRSLGTVAMERNGFFSSADLGAAAVVAMPKKRGEVYVAIVNGNGYTAQETDRFKDVAARVTLTPFANSTGMIKSLAISPWYLMGGTASAFQNGGAGQVGKVPEAVTKDRMGVFVGIKERKLTGGVEFAQRTEGVESGANTAGNPRVVKDSTSKLTSLFALIRPMEWINKDKQSPWGIVARMDNYKFHDNKVFAATYSVFGLYWDITPKATLTLDVQSLGRPSGSTTIPTNTIFLHWKADF